MIKRIHSALEQGNIKLSNVASDIMGVSDRAMIKAMSNGESDPAKLAALSQGRLKAGFEQLVEALDGQLNENQRWLLKRLLGQVKTLEDEIAIYSERIAEQMRPYKTQLERLDTIGGIGQRSAARTSKRPNPSKPNRRSTSVCRASRWRTERAR